MDLNKPGSAERAIALSDIYAAIQRYAYTARNGIDWSVKAQAFTPEAKIVLPNGTSLPISEMSKLVRGQEAEYYRHHITVIDVHFVDTNKAKATSQLFVITNKSRCDHWGEWQDTLVRENDGRWLIEEKVLVVDGCDPQGWYASTYGQI